MRSQKGAPSRARMIAVIGLVGAACSAASAQVLTKPNDLTGFNADRMDNWRIHDGAWKGQNTRGTGINCPADFLSFNCSGIDVTLGANFSVEDGFRTADNFKLINGDTLTGVCWAGRYANDTPPDDDGITAETFRVTIYASSAENIPDTSNIVFQQEFTTGVDMVRELYDPDGVGFPNADEFLWSIDGLAVELGHDNCYWLEIVNTSADLTVSGNWGWVGAGAALDAVSYQALNSDYTLFSQIPDDRAFCVKGADLDIDQAFICPPPPIPEICQLDDINGQPYDGVTGFGFAAAAPGSTPPASGAYTPFERGESFSFGSAGELSGVCFWTFWFDTANVQVAGPTQPTDLRVAIYETNPLNGAPQADPIAEYITDGTSASVVGDGEEYSVTFLDNLVTSEVGDAAIAIEGDTCYWVSIATIVDGDDPSDVRVIWFLTSDGSAPDAPAPAPFDHTIGVRTMGAGGVPGVWSTFDLTGANSPISNLSFVFDWSGTPGLVTPDCEPPPPPPPANDDCDGAIDLGSDLGLFAYTYRGATPSAPTDTCGATPLNNDVWFTWTAPCDGDYSINGCGVETSDTTLGVLAGADPCNPDTLVGCSDDECGQGGGPSMVNFTANEGDHFIIRIAQFAQGIGSDDAVFQIEKTDGECEGGPTCLCDVNGADGVTSQDFFDFLGCFFAPPPDGGVCDVNGVDGVTSQDFFDFLGCFFAPPGECAP